jgi:thiamine biosynthesis lipoprotein
VTRPPSPAPAGPGTRRFERSDGCVVGRFRAMGSPCEVFIDTDDREEGRALVHVAADEALRIERKFSRYRDDNLLHLIHHAHGEPIEVDEETALLLDYAATCHELSDGRFDITSGVLRRVWRFDGGEVTPSPERVREALAQVGWERVTWTGRTLTLPAGMEIDLGGIGKEYAVDRALSLLAARGAGACLVNFGGDLAASGPRRGERPWAVGVDDPARTGLDALGRVDLSHGGLATSGDARRFVISQGRRLGHILDPRTGWPVEDAPAAITVLAPTCLEAGTLATLAYLRGGGARAFLDEQGARYWIVDRDAA